MKLEEYIEIDYIKRVEVWDWANSNEINLEYCDTIKRYNNILKDVWRVENEKHRMAVTLRWA